MSEKHLFAEGSVLLDRLLHAEQEVVFLVGAPLCMPHGEVPGVPAVGGMIDLIRREFEPTVHEAGHRAERKQAALAELDEAISASNNPYQAAFHFLITRRGLQTANRLITRAVLGACRTQLAGDGSDALPESVLDTLEYDPDAWHLPPAVRALGRIVARFGERFGRAVLTTNFDPLIEVAIRAAGGNAHSAVLVADGTLESTRGEGTLVVHAHGYWHGADTLHTPAALETERPALRRSLARLYERRLLVVMAYGGWDDVFTRTLADIVGDQGAFTEIVWCFYDDDVDRILEREAHILDQLKPALARQRATLIRGVDCHTVLPALLEALDLDAAHADEEVVGRETLCKSLLETLGTPGAVHLVGEPQMGRSALLDWLERRPVPEGWRSVQIDAANLTRNDPVDLGWAVADALGRKDELADVFRARTAVPELGDALAGFEALLPLRLLIDNADELAARGHRFQSAFFERLGEWAAEGRLQWISTGVASLAAAFGRSRVSAPFLDDARTLPAGALEGIAVRRLLTDALGAGAARQALKLGGTLPTAVRWLSKQRGPLTSDPFGTLQRFRAWIRPLFARWWRNRTDAEQRILREAARGALPIDRTDETDLPIIERLLRRGLLVELDGAWACNGIAWRDFVRR